MSRFVIPWFLFLVGCAEKPQLSCDVDGGAVSAQLLEATTNDLLTEIRAVRQRLKADEGLVGLRASILRQFADTNAYDFAVSVNALRANVARQKAREMAWLNDGDTLLGTKREWQCKTFADSVASLDVGQSQSQFLQNLDRVESHFQKLAGTTHQVREKRATQ